MNKIKIKRLINLKINQKYYFVVTAILVFQVAYSNSYLATISKLAPQSISLSKVIQEGKEITVMGVASQVENVSAFMKVLEENNYHSLDLKFLKKLTDGYEFKLTSIAN
jgi:Tfp pilus assembly protein PilN